MTVRVARLVMGARLPGAARVPSTPGPSVQEAAGSWSMRHGGRGEEGMGVGGRACETRGGLCSELV